MDLSLFQKSPKPAELTSRTSNLPFSPKEKILFSKREKEVDQDFTRTLLASKSPQPLKRSPAPIKKVVERTGSDDLNRFQPAPYAPANKERFSPDNKSDIKISQVDKSETTPPDAEYESNHNPPSNQTPPPLGRKDQEELMEEDLDKLVDLAQSPQFIRDEIPIIAFLTGHLEEIVPKDIPGLVLENSFVKESLAGGDIHQFLTTPQPLEDILQSLEATPVLLEEIISLGIDTTQSITPQEIFRALGIDPSRISSELFILRDNLQVDGLTPYMIRAAALRGQFPNEDRTPASQIADQEQNHSPMPMPMARDNIAAKVKTESANLPNVRTTNEDPFALLGQKMNPEQTTQVNFAMPSATEEGTVPLMQKSKFHLLNEAMLKQPDKTVLDSAAMVDYQENLDGEIILSSPAEEASMLLTPSQRIIKQNAEWLQANQPTNQSPTTPKGEGELNLIREFDTLTTDAVSQHRDGDAHKGPRSDINHRSQTHFDILAKAGQPNPMEGSNPVPKPFTLEHGAAGQMTSSAVTQKVLHHASMLVKEGGGAIRIDLGTKDLGHLDLAIHIKDQKLDLRILTSSDGARELVLNDLPRLKEALAGQKLDLQNVEISVGGGGVWGESSSDGGQSQHQFFEEYKEDLDGQSHFLSSHSYSKVTPRKPLSPLSHQGQIEVLA